MSRPISRRPHTTGRGNSGLNIQIDLIGFGGSRIEQKPSPNFFYTLFLYSSHFLEFIGQFLQPPAFGHRQAEPSLARPLCTNLTRIQLTRGGGTILWILKDFIIYDHVSGSPKLLLANTALMFSGFLSNVALQCLHCHSFTPQCKTLSWA